MPQGDRSASDRRAAERAARRKAEARARRARRGGRRPAARGRWRRPVAMVLIAGVVLALSSQLLIGGGGDDDDDGPTTTTAKLRPRFVATARPGSVPAPSAKGVLGFADVPTAYDITYAVEDHAGGSLVRSTQRVRVRRPFESRIETRRGAPPGTGSAQVQISGFARIHFPSAGGATASSIIVPPFIAGSDLRFDAVANELVEHHRAERREQRTVARRRCQVYRSVSQLGAGDPAPLGAEPADFVDTCVDRRGLVLEEVTVTERRLLRRQLAVRVADHAELAASLFPLGTPAKEGTGLGSVLEVRTTAGSIGPFYEVGAVPAGFTDHRRYAVVPPQPQTGDVDPDATRERRIAGVYDVWRRGPDVLLVDQSGTVGRVQGFEMPEHALPAEVPLPGKAGLVLDPRMAELRVLQEKGRVVRVMGTIPPAELLAVARSMTLTQGKGLEYLQPPPGATTTTTTTVQGHAD